MKSYQRKVGVQKLEKFSENSLVNWLLDNTDEFPSGLDLQDLRRYYPLLDVLNAYRACKILRGHLKYERTEEKLQGLFPDLEIDSIHKIQEYCIIFS